jgi:hypothetical protein
MRLPKTRTLGATAIESGPIDAGGSGNLFPSGTSMRLWTKLPTGSILPLSNDSCPSPPYLEQLKDTA